MEYVCNEYTHPLEDTYWKSRVCIYIKDEENGAYQLDTNYSHWGRRATMEDSIQDAAFEACLGLYGRRFDDMKGDQYHFLPRQQPELEWAMMDPEGMDPTTQVMVDFAYDLVEKNRWLEGQLKAQGKSLKSC